MTELDDLLDAIARAEAERALRQVATEQALEHRNSLIREAVRDRVDRASIANAANVSAERVDEINSFK